MKRYHSHQSRRKRARRKRQTLECNSIERKHRRDPCHWFNSQNFNKRSPYDCGNARCPICQNPRYRDRPRIKGVSFLEDQDGKVS